MSGVGRRLTRLALLGVAALGAGQGAGQTPHPGAGAAMRERAMTELRARVPDPGRLQHALVVEGLERRGATGRIDVKLVEECDSLGLTLEDVLRLCLRAMRRGTDRADLWPRIKRFV